MTEKDEISTRLKIDDLVNEKFSSSKELDEWWYERSPLLSYRSPKYAIETHEGALKVLSLLTGH